MIIFPLFWDQYDNAQRVDERGFGRRLDTYGATDDQIVEAVESLLADDEMKARLASISQQLQGRTGPACRRRPRDGSNLT